MTAELFPAHTKTATLRAIHSAASNEWYTPPEIVEKARAVLGVIDLDPASSATANTIVKATVHHGQQAEDFVDGLGVHGWYGNVFLNPPGPAYVDVLDAQGKQVMSKRPTKTGKIVPLRQKIDGTGTEAWWRRLTAEMATGRVARAFYVAYSIEQFQQTQGWTPGSSLLDVGVVCVPRQRIRFWRIGPDGPERGEQPTHASALALLGPGVTPLDVRRFHREFADVGAIIGAKGGPAEE